MRASRQVHALALACAFLVTALPAVALAQCSITALTSTVPVTTGTSDQDFSFTQSAAYWTAVGVRAASGSADWDAYVYSTSSPFPTCVSGLLASSARSAGITDVVVGDFNSNVTGTYLVRARHFSADAVTATVQWDDGPDVMPLNGPQQLLTLPSTDVVKCYDVFLDQGQSYHFTYEAIGNAKVLLYRNPANAPFWAGRNGALLTMASSSAGTDFQAPATDWYGLVLVNDGLTDVYYWLTVGVCDPIRSLTSRVPIENLNANDYYQFNVTTGPWNAVGTRPDVDATGEQDMKVYSGGSGTAPECFTGAQAISNYNQGTANVLAGDFSANGGPLGTWYGASRYAVGQTADPGARTQWDGDGRVVLVNDPYASSGSMGVNDIVDCWSVYLEAGKSYDLNTNIPQNLYITAHCIENPNGGPYWSSSSLSIPSITPNHTGWHALIMDHERNDSGSYTFWITRCETPTALANDVAVRTPDPTGYYSFTQSTNYWTAVAAHSTSLQVDWDLQTFGSGSGGTAPTCFSSLLTNSANAAGTTDFVVGDFNTFGNTQGTYYVHPFRYSGDADAYTEWDTGADQINPGDPMTHVVFSDSDFVRCYDVFLTNGVTYTMIFNAAQSVNARAFLFKSSNAPYWVGRGAAYFQTASNASFTVPAGDFYGLVVVNDGGSGAVDFRINTANVAVNGPDLPRVTALRNVGPNPDRGPLTLGFDLATSADITFELIDIAGRVVATRAAEHLDAGSWSRAWDPFRTFTRGAGIYFLRMRVAGREIAERKIARLE